MPTKTKGTEILLLAPFVNSSVRVISAREPIGTGDASEILLESVLEGMAEYFSKELS